MQFLAAIIATYYVKKYRAETSARYFSYFLWLTVIIETIGSFPILIDNLPSLAHLKDTSWEKNLWMYNIYLVVSFAFYMYYISMHIYSRFLKKSLYALIILYLSTSTINLIISDVFFKAFSSYSFILGSLSLLITIGLYFYQVLQSNDILNFGYTIPFYFSIGVLVFHLCVTPLFIYSKYNSRIVSPEFVDIYGIILTIANIFLYTCYTLGFIICSQQKKTSRENRSY